MQLDDTLEGFWLSKRRNLSPNTARDYELTFQRLVDWLKTTEWGRIRNSAPSNRHTSSSS
jgi:hypothetical protein